MNNMNMAGVFLFGAICIAPVTTVSAAPEAGSSMVDSASGVSLAWVPPGCFLPANVQPVKAAGKKSATHLLRLPASSGNQLIEFDALDDAPLTILAQAPRAQGNQTCLSKGFWMAQFEITQGQYQNIMGNNPSAFKQGADYPVENVRWLDAQAFIRKLNAVSGKAYRLPSEAEWEYAARSAGHQASYTHGSISKVAWFMINSGDSSHPVGRKQANALGIYDMAGNVWEWTQDCWNPVVDGAPKDGSAWTLGHCSSRVLRGGSWFDAESMMSIKTRLHNDTDKSDNTSGFRIVLD